MRFQLLGPIGVWDGTRPIPLGGPKQRLVLAHLLLRAQRVVQAESLIDLVWGDAPPFSARASLHSYVSNLRRALGSDRVTRQPSGYLLSASPDEVDAAQFETIVARARRTAGSDPAAAAGVLREALDLWRGDPIADLKDEPSLWPEIHRLTELRFEALETRNQAELDTGRHLDIVADLESMQLAHPLRERFGAQLMLALYRSDRQADALAAFHRMRTTLADELGVDPSPSLERLQLQILRHDPVLELRGEPLRGYRLLEPLGSGRLGRVHRGFEPVAGRDVAIKVLGPRVANHPEFIRSFDTHAGRIAGLEHPHVVPLYDWWREPDAAFLVTRLMAGGSLAIRLGRRDIPPDDALVWVQQIGSALAAAHRHGLVHGDLRPENILLDGEGNAYLTDFSVGYDLSPMPASMSSDVDAFGSLAVQLLGTVAPRTATPEVLASLARITSHHESKASSRLAALIGAAGRALLHDAAASDGVETVGQNPYKGLRAFGEADASDFFGREALVEQLVARMNDAAETPRLLAVVGPSGCGKSSVVSAGLLPAVRAGAVAGSQEWFIASMTPGGRPFEHLEQALAGVSVEPEAPLSDLLNGDHGVREAVRRSLPRDAALLLFIDQFEELFTLVPDHATRARFLSVLADAVADPASGVRLLITIRADFYDQPLNHDRFGAQLAARTQAVPPLTPEQLERAIAGPAEGAGLHLEPGLAARVIAEMSERPGGLPLLQYALTELWERRDGDRLSLSAYDASGGMLAAVARRAEMIFLELDHVARAASRQVFLRLLELGEGTADTTRRMLRSDLEGLVPDGPQVAAVIERFARYRMLILDRDADSRAPTVEMAHDALLRAWPRLRGWIEDSRDDLREQRALALATEQWVRGSRDPSYLLTGSRLQRAQEWESATQALLTPREREYLGASLMQRRSTEEREERRRQHALDLERRAVARLRALVVTLGMGALIAGGLSIFALNESQRAEHETRIATARELAAAAVSNLALDPERSVLLALEAVHATRSSDGTVLPEAEEALHRAVSASRIVRRIVGVGGSLSWSPVDDMFVTEGPENSLMLDLRSTTTGASIREWRAHAVDVNAVAFSPDGSLLLSTGDDGTAALWRHDLPEQPPIRIHGRGEVWGPTFSPDGRHAAAVWRDERLLRVWKTSAPLEVRDLPIPGRPSDASISPDGGSVAVTLKDRPVVIIVDIASGVIRPYELSHGLEAFAAAWSPDGRWIATAGRAPAVRVWDARTGELHQTPPAHSGDAITVRWSSDPTLLATGGSDGGASLWQIREDGHTHLLSLAAHDTTTGVAGLAFSPDGDFLMTSDASITGTQIWDIRVEGEAEWMTREGEFGTQGGVAFLPDGRLLSSNDDGSVSVTDVRSRRAREVGTHESVVPAIAASSDGAMIATAGGADGVANLWKTDGAAHHFGVRHRDTVLAVDVSADGALLASADTSGRVKITDLSGAPVVELVDDPDSDILAVRFSPDGGRLAVTREGTRGGESSVAIWDWRAGEIQAVLPFARDVAWDAAGLRIATGGASPNVDLWDVETGHHRATLTGEIAQLWGVAWSPDDTRIAAGSLDGTIRLWNVETGLLTLTLRGHSAPVNSLAFSPDGSQLASRSWDGTTRVWALDIDDLIELASRRIRRGLTDAECLQHLRIPTCGPSRSP